MAEQTIEQLIAAVQQGRTVPFKFVLPFKLTAKQARIPDFYVEVQEDRQTVIADMDLVLQNFEGQNVIDLTPEMITKGQFLWDLWHTYEIENPELDDPHFVQLHRSVTGMCERIFTKCQEAWEDYDELMTIGRGW